MGKYCVLAFMFLNKFISRVWYFFIYLIAKAQYFHASEEVSGQEHM